jgi:hydroxymethylglutaryl-CoA synthase
MNIGIDLISFYTPPFFLSLTDLAAQRKISAEKYTIGIGQDEMSILPPDEDVVTMGANAAQSLLDKVDKTQIKALIFATESGVDQSKSAGMFVHRLLGLSKECRVIEMKQACYSGTFSLRSAMGLISLQKNAKVLVINSDVARYDLNSPGEPTQGCGAVALIVSNNPRLLKVESESAYISEDVMDFWRPNYRSSAIVDGQYSTKIYLKALNECWKKYGELTKRLPEHVHHFCFHLPFTRMAEKALKQLFRCKEEFQSRFIKSSPGFRYNRVVGNSYTASLYLNLCSLLDCSAENLEGHRVGLFSYGSGFVAEFFSGVIQAGYGSHLLKDLHSRLISQRKKISYREYLEFYHYALPEQGEVFNVPHFTNGHFRFSGLDNHKRLYEKTVS